MLPETVTFDWANAPLEARPAIARAMIFFCIDFSKKRVGLNSLQ
jgi:hypothetical protein